MDAQAREALAQADACLRVAEAAGAASPGRQSALDEAEEHLHDAELLIQALRRQAPGLASSLEAQLRDARLRQQRLTQPPPGGGITRVAPAQPAAGKSREALLAGSAVLHGTGVRLQEAHRTALSAEAAGEDVLAALAQQRGQLHRMREQQDGVRTDVDASNKTLDRMERCVVM